MPNVAFSWPDSIGLFHRPDSSQPQLAVSERTERGSELQLSGVRSYDEWSRRHGARCRERPLRPTTCLWGRSKGLRSDL
jgi:hypothetical protein